MSAKKCEPPPQDPIATPQKATFLRLGHKNHSQWNALGSASFILISGGMSLAWGAGFAVHSAHREQLLLTVHMQIAWYVTAILGALFGAFYTHRLPQQPIYVSRSEKNCHLCKTECQWSTDVYDILKCKKKFIETRKMFI